jgi:hypothetical protein
VEVLAYSIRFTVRSIAHISYLVSYVFGRERLILSRFSVMLRQFNLSFNMLQLMTSVKYKAILQSVAAAGKISVTTNDATHD